ncbi:putative vinorine synthase [Helianthus debilis subsp. tardiflorus]
MYDVYTPTILFIRNTDKDSVSDVLTKRSKHLKESLSKILTTFYPFAGKVKDNMQIECNDEGLYYIEARVNETLEDFLQNVDDERVRRLKPEKPCTEESSKGNYVIGIQVNIFKCGGIGLSTSTSHKIFDAHTIFILLKAWAAAARGSPEIVSPSFIAPEIFPNKPCLKDAASPQILTTKMITTKRFVFDSSALATLKAQAVASGSSTRPPTRTVATTAVIWKAVAKAASKVRPFGPQSPHALFSVVNLRKRASPPLPNESIGNLIDLAGAVCFPDGQLDLATMMGDLIDSMARINSDHIESLKGENGHSLFSETLKIANHLSGGDSLAATSVLNSGMYELDFGWGKPLWFYVMSSTNARSVTLNETHKGGGVEAIVTLSPDEMEIFERDSELLSYATINPSPLQFVL